MLRHGLLRVVLAIAAIGVASPLQAQTQLPVSSVSQLIDALFQPSEPFNPNRETLISPDEYARRQRDSREGIGIGIGTALASFPLGASSAGFAYSIDPATGAPQLKAVTFGGILTDRATTNGRGVFNVGFTYQQSSFDVLQGLDLKSGGFPTQSQLGTYEVPLANPTGLLPNGADVGDAWRAELDTKSQVFVFSGSVGVSNQLDVGWAIPVASVKVNARFMRDYDAARDYDAFPQIRPLYPNRSGTLVQAEGSAEASGVGDIVIRGKYGFGSASRQIGLLIGELRLPTGDEDNLLGAGKTSFRLIAGASQQFGSAAVNVNGGYTAGGLTDEVNFAAGAELGLLPRKQLTVTAEVATQTLRDTVTGIGEFESFNQLNPDPGGVLGRRVIVRYGFWSRGSTTLARAAIGGKYHLAGNLLVTGSGLFRLNENGYQPKVAALVGLEYTWVRK
jgi:hypothetical protein